jgi:hypothetical protein
MPALRPLFLPGVQYEGETVEQMEARETRTRELLALIDADERRLAEWKNRPWWEDPPQAPRTAT